MKIHCEEPWFSKIKNGEKVIEGRKKSPVYSSLNPGDLLSFYADDDSFDARVVEVREYKTLEDYLVMEGVRQALPGVNSLAEAIAVYRQWSTEEQLKKAGGFLSIQIDVMS